RLALGGVVAVGARVEADERQAPPLQLGEDRAEPVGGLVGDRDRLAGGGDGAPSLCAGGSPAFCFCRRGTRHPHSSPPPPSPPFAAGTGGATGRPSGHGSPGSRPRRS